MSSQSSTDFSKVPVGKPPPGVTPNFDNPPSLTPTLIGLCVFLITWGTTFAFIRIWVNRRRLNVGDGDHTLFGPPEESMLLNDSSFCDCCRHSCHCLLLNSTFMSVTKPDNNSSYRLLIGLVASYFRHTWDLPLSWYTPGYIKVGIQGS